MMKVESNKVVKNNINIEKKNNFMNGDDRFGTKINSPGVTNFLNSSCCLSLKFSIESF